METPLPVPPPLPDLVVQGIRDEEHLRVLSIGYYVVGGFTALFSCFAIFYVVIGLMLVGGMFHPMPSRGRPPARRVLTTGDVFNGSVPLVTGGNAAAVRPPPSAKPFSPVGEATPPAEPPPPDPARHLDRHRPPFPRGIGYAFVAIGSLVVLIGWTVGGLTIYAGRCLQRRRRRTFTLIMAGVNCFHLPFGTALGVFTFVVLQRPTVAALYASRAAGSSPSASV